jgi:hypothetical protein
MATLECVVTDVRTSDRAKRVVVAGCVLAVVAPIVL